MRAAKVILTGIDLVDQRNSAASQELEVQNVGLIKIAKKELKGKTSMSCAAVAKKTTRPGSVQWSENLRGHEIRRESRLRALQWNH